MKDNLPYLVLEKFLLSNENSIVIFSIINILTHFTNNKIPINNNHVIENFNKLIILFPKISVDQWINYLIIFLKHNADPKKWNIIINIIANKDNNKENIIFKNPHVTIKCYDNNIEFIYKDKNLIDGNKYLYKNHIMNHSLQYRLNQLKNNLINNMMKEI